MKRPDCWEVLEIHPTRDLILIRDAFRKQVKRYHPDSSAQYTSQDLYNFLTLKRPLMKPYKELNLIIYRMSMKRFQKIILIKLFQHLNLTLFSIVFLAFHLENFLRP